MGLSQKPKIIGIFLMFLSITMLSPIIIDHIYHENNLYPFLVSFIVTFLSGFIMWFIARKSTKKLTNRDGFLIVALVWGFVTLYGAIPYLTFPGLNLTFTHAVFESASGFTTTGGTVISGLQHLPHSILFYRQQTEFFGGMGIIVLSVAILPLLGVGGMQLYKAEISGQWKDEKIAPKISSTAKALWLVYLLFTFLCFFSYLLVGMDPFDALCYTFSTVSTGGFTPTDASMTDKSTGVLIVCGIFMFLGATSFKAHFIALSRLSIKHYFRNVEFKAYCYLLFFASAVVAITMISFSNDLTDIPKTITDSIFQVVALSSSAGFVSDSSFYLWPSFLPIMLMFLAIIGGCGGSTAGGLKMIRAILFKEKAVLEAKRVIHPQGVFTAKLGDIHISEQALNRVSGYISVYIIIFGAAWLALLGCGLDVTTAFSTAATTLSNVGPGLGEIGTSFGTLPDKALWICDLTMIAGRLEIFTILVLFMPEFWRK